MICDSRDADVAISTNADSRFIWSPAYVDAMVPQDRNAHGSTTTGTGRLDQRGYALQDSNQNTTEIIAASGVLGVTVGNVVTASSTPSTANRRR